MGHTGDTDERIGTELGVYRLDECIGAGATGTVYRATNTDSSEEVAVKVLAGDIANREVLKKRFEREARVLRRLQHGSIVRIENFGLDEDCAYIVMELLEGETLEERLRRAPVNSRDALAIMREVLDALGHAHREGIVHRDLKPANVFLLAQEGTVRVLDFGLAKFLSHDEADPEGTLTRKGRVVGTPAYMAPEQITGIGVDARADVYAAGVMLYEMLADRRPFLQRKRSQLMRAHLFDEVPAFADLAGMEAQDELEAIVRRALKKDPQKRYLDGAAFADALRGIEGREVIRTRTEERSRSGVTSVVIDALERVEAENAGGLPWHRKGWVTAAVWLISLAAFALAAGTMVYAGVYVR